jgi:hypothetical protein
VQITDTLLMVRPAAFAYNAETADTNFFQNNHAYTASELQQKVLREFDTMVHELKVREINVVVVDDTIDPIKPDAIFPNNWLTIDHNGVIDVFPMQARSRRLEKRDDILQMLTKHFLITDVIDWSEYEADALYLEGTGSMVMDHQHKIIYACLSGRTSKSLVEKYAASKGYRAITFTAHDINGKNIYHTNVMMCIGEGFAVLCPKAITDDNERIAVAQLLETTGHENIYITHDQMKSFAGNRRHVKNQHGKRFIILSKTANDVLTESQKQRLQNYGELLPIDVSVIEQVEGGSVRCMMAEMFTPSRI